MSFEDYQGEVEDAVRTFAANGYLIQRVPVDVNSWPGAGNGIARLTPWAISHGLAALLS